MSTAAAVPEPPTNHCSACGLDFFYASNLHECADPNLTTPRTTWAEECVAKVMSDDPVWEATVRGELD